MLRTWTVPLERDGRAVKVRGETVWKPVKRGDGDSQRRVGVTLRAAVAG